MVLLIHVRSCVPPSFLVSKNIVSEPMLDLTLVDSPSSLDTL